MKQEYNANKEVEDMLSDDEKVAIYNKGLKKGLEHADPSPDTKVFMTEIKGEISYIKEKLEKIPTRDEMLLCIEQAVDKTLEKAENKFASKLVEKIVWGIVGAIGVSFLGYLGWLVFNSTIHIVK